MQIKSDADLRAELEAFSDEELKEIKDFKIDFSEECPVEFARAFNRKRYVAEDLLATRQADQPWAISFRKIQNDSEKWFQSVGIRISE